MLGLGNTDGKYQHDSHEQSQNINGQMYGSTLFYYNEL